MCGIAGVVAREPGDVCARSSSAQLAHARAPRARRPGRVRGRLAARSARTASRSSTSSPATRRSRTRTARSASRSTARSTTSASCARSSQRAATRCDRRATPRSSPISPRTLDPVELARRLDGMFAFAVWDERRGRLVLGRDRFGKKPLYYWCSAGRLVFGSEIKAVLAHPAVPRRLDAGGDPRLPDLRLRADAAHVLRGRPQPAARPRAHASSRAASRAIERYWEPPVAGRRRRRPGSTSRCATPPPRCAPASRTRSSAG